MKVFFLISIVFLISCSLFKKKTDDNIVIGTVKVHKPYCGGARPSPEMEKGTYMPFKNTSFIVKTSMANDPKTNTVATFITDENGEFKINLKPGKYVVIHEDKALPFDKYVLKYNKPTTYMQYVGDKEAKNIYEMYDCQFIVEENKAVEVILKSKCFVGTNFCLKYTGPLPQ